MSDTVVFLGPSLSLDKAHQIMLDALYLPPVRCGDVLHVMRLKPKKIIIIDGYFEKTSAVWHKEILYALSKGIQVYGAASMGALRAAELYPFGMIGYGAIFEAYQSGQYTDDDEVAVLHTSEHPNYVSFSDSLVNIRSTMEVMVTDGVLKKENRNELLNQLKSAFYHKRKLQNFVEMADQSWSDQLNYWIEEKGFVDQKQEDAINLLKLVKNNVTANLKPFEFSSSMFFKALQRKIATKPYHLYSPNLPIQERVMQVSRLLGKKYRRLKTLSMLLSCVYSLPKNQFNEQRNEAFVVEFCAHNDKWATENDLGQNQFLSFLERHRAIAQYYFDSTYGISDEIIRSTTNTLLKIAGELHSDLSSNEFKEYFYIAYLILVIKEVMSKNNIKPTNNAINESFNKYLVNNGLLNQDKIVNWCNHNAISDLELREIAELIFYFDQFVIKDNSHIINAGYTDENISWLLEALYLTNNYSVVRKILFNFNRVDSMAKELIKKSEAQERERFLYSIDFDGGLEEFEQFICQINPDNQFTEKNHV